MKTAIMFILLLGSVFTQLISSDDFEEINFGSKPCEQVVEKPPTPAPTPIPLPDNIYSLPGPHTCLASKKPYIDESASPPTLAKREGCGWRNPKGIGIDVTNDENLAKYGEFPWTVAVFEIACGIDPDKTLLYSFEAAGSLIHPSIVLTVAHAVISEKPLRVRAGVWDSTSTNETYPHQDRIVKKVVVNDLFSMDYYHNDVALLFLESPIIMSLPNVGIACLPASRKRVPGGLCCLTAGWGMSSFVPDRKYRDILQKLELLVVDHHRCLEKIRRRPMLETFSLDASFMCTVDELRREPCIVAEGSPLMCPIEHQQGRYMQSGIVVGNLGCNEMDNIGFSLDVAIARDWIDEEVIKEGYERKGYTYN